MKTKLVGDKTSELFYYDLSTGHTLTSAWLRAPVTDDDC